MTEFKNFIKGKSVAFVGMAPVIMGGSLGSEIDTFDVVIRTNVFPIPEDYRKDYGAKCEVISMLKSSAINPETFVPGGIKWVIHYRPVTGRNLSDKLMYYDMTVARRMEIRADIMKVMQGFNPGHGTAGVNIIATLLKCSPSRIKAFGVTGYQDKNGKVIDHNKGVKHYIPYFTIRNGITSMERHPCHKLTVQNDWLRHLLKTGQIEMDPYSHEYFK